MTQRRVIIRFALLGLGFVLLAFGAFALFVYVKSEHVITRKYEAPRVAMVLPTDAASLEEGKRLARIRGCFGGCHGKLAEGQVWEDSFWTGHVVAPDLTRLARELSPEDLARTVREGVRVNGESVWDMPSPMFFHLADADMAAIIAFLKSEPLRNGLERRLAYGPRQRWDVVRGELTAFRDDIVKFGAPERVVDRTDAIAFGRYLARTVCSECHGNRLEGGDHTPNLHVIAQAYSLEQFTRLMRTGKAIGERELRLMSSVARSRFAYFTPEEIAALYDFLRSKTT